MANALQDNRLTPLWLVSVHVVYLVKYAGHELWTLEFLIDPKGKMQVALINGLEPMYHVW